VYTSSAFHAGAAVTGFPYKKAGYDDLYVFGQCLGASYGSSLYLGGTVSQTSLGRACGVLGLDCAGFIGKAFALGHEDYTTPSMIHNNCPAVGAGTDYPKAKPADVLKCYGNPCKATHFMLVANNEPASSRLTVHEAGSVFSSVADRVRTTTIPYASLAAESFLLCTPKGITDP
jgi:hypothetical protein